MTRLILLIAIFTGVVVLTPDLRAAPPDDARPLAPNPVAQEAAARVFETLHGKDVAAAGTAEAKSALARQLFAEAGQRIDPAERYVWLMRASKLPTQASDVEAVLATIDEVAKIYHVDVLNRKIAALSALRKRVPYDDSRLFLARLNKSMDQAVAEDHYDLAVGFAKIAYDVAFSINRSSCPDEVNEKLAYIRLDELRDIDVDFDAIGSDRARLQTTPADPVGNLNVGRFLCFDKGDWTHGLPMLAKGSDETLRALAKRDSAPPQQPEAQICLADAWWELAAGEEDAIQREMRRHSLTWYERGISARAITNSIGMKFLSIPAGEFDMGSPASEVGRGEDEDLHHVKIAKPYLLQTAPVTQAQWSAIMGSVPNNQRDDLELDWSYADLKDRCPVVQVSWDEAMAFCGKLGAKEGKHYRLPTEEEWEYACRAGSHKAYGRDEERNEMRWHSRIWPGSEIDAVAQQRPNPWGIYDMLETVRQRCSDHNIRGGSYSRCASRYSEGWFDTRNQFTGFRVVLDSR